MTEIQKMIDKAIKDVYESPEGLGSMQKTYEVAKQKLDAVTKQDVKNLFESTARWRRKLRCEAGTLTSLPKPVMSLKWMFSLCPNHTQALRKNQLAYLLLTYSVNICQSYQF